MNNSDTIWVQSEFNEAYDEYTKACHNVSTAHTEDAKMKSAKDLKKASERFDEAYKNLKILQGLQYKEE